MKRERKRSWKWAVSNAGEDKRRRLEAAERRRVRSGKEYDHLFPRPLGKEITVKKSADVGDTVSFIQKIVPDTLKDTEKVAKLLKGKTLEETCKNIWHFAYDHIPYKRDKDGVEQVRRPARTWWDRNHAGEDGKVGVDCDCYTVFLSSIFMNLRIPHKYRIAKYPKEPPEIPHWQHIYIVIPLDGKLNHQLYSRDDYIVMDCVKDGYDEEHPYLEKKDYNMRLDYLNGLEGTGMSQRNVDEMEMLSAIEDENDLEGLGKIRIGKFIQKVGHSAGQGLKKVGQVAKAAAQVASKGIRVVKNVAGSPLRNAFLLAMKINFLGVAKKLRYAYLTDQQAMSKGMNMTVLAHIRKVKDSAENIFFKAGGSKDNVRLAILKGAGNKDQMVPLSGLDGFNGNEEEYEIINGANGLGVLPAAGALAIVAPILTALAKALSTAKGLFPKGSKEAAEDESGSSDTSAATTETAPAEITNESSAIEDNSQTDQSATIINDDSGVNKTSNDHTNINTTVMPALPDQSGGNKTSIFQSTAPVQRVSALAPQTGTDEKPKAGILGWAKENPLLATGIAAGVVATGAYFIFRKKSSATKGSLSGLPGRRRKSKKHKSGNRKEKLSAIKIR